MTRDSRAASDGPREPDFDAALRWLARDDARRAEEASPRVMTHLVAEFRALQSTGSRALRVQSRGRRVTGLSGRRWIPNGGAAFGLALAATLLVAIAVPLCVISRGGVGRRGAPMAGYSVAGSGESEVTTAFLPLPYSAVPTRDPQIVRIEVPRAALAAFGLLPAEDQTPRSQDVVLADVIVGEDGLARAVRFVRAPIARAE